MQIRVKHSVTNILTFNYIISLRMEINILEDFPKPSISES